MTLCTVVSIDVNVPDALSAIHGDANLLHIAVGNLLSNANKYAGDGRWIGIRAEHSARERSILIHVADHGPGIDAEDQEHLFEPLCRGLVWRNKWWLFRPFSPCPFNPVRRRTPS
jgi:signal transduction histidine kinase